MKQKLFGRIRLILLIVLIISCGFFLLSPAESFADASTGEAAEAEKEKEPAVQLYAGSTEVKINNSSEADKPSAADELSKAFETINNGTDTDYRIVLNQNISDCGSVTLSRSGVKVTLVGNGHTINMAEGGYSSLIKTAERH